MENQWKLPNAGITFLSNVLACHQEVFQVLRSLLVPLFVISYLAFKDYVYDTCKTAVKFTVQR